MFDQIRVNKLQFTSGVAVLPRFRLDELINGEMTAVQLFCERNAKTDNIYNSNIVCKVAYKACQSLFRSSLSLIVKKTIK
jgi:hypothetical protein